MRFGVIEDGRFSLMGSKEASNELQAFGGWDGSTFLWRLGNLRKKSKLFVAFFSSLSKDV